MVIVKQQTRMDCHLIQAIRGQEKVHKYGKMEGSWIVCEMCKSVEKGTS